MYVYIYDCTHCARDVTRLATSTSRAYSFGDDLCDRIWGSFSCLIKPFSLGSKTTFFRRRCRSAGAQDLWGPQQSQIETHRAYQHFREVLRTSEVVSASGGVLEC